MLQHQLIPSIDYFIREKIQQSCVQRNLTSALYKTVGRARSNSLAGRSTALAQALAQSLPIALLCFGNSVNRK